MLGLLQLLLYIRTTNYIDGNGHYCHTKFFHSSEPGDIIMYIILNECNMYIIQYDL